MATASIMNQQQANLNGETNLKDGQPETTLRNSSSAPTPWKITGDEGWFTGKVPRYGVCPGVNEADIIASLGMHDLKALGRTEVLEYFDNTWTLDEVLFAGIKTRSAFYQPLGGSKPPLIFFFGHPVTFYVNKFKLAGLIDESIDAHIEYILGEGVGPDGDDSHLPKRTEDWPTIEELMSYRARVYQMVRGVISRTDFSKELGRPIHKDDAAWVVLMACEHERIHLDLTSCWMRRFPVDLLSRHPAWPAPASSARTSKDKRLVPTNDMIRVPGGDAILGKKEDFQSFGWDNEYGHLTTRVADFEASRYLISNGEFYEFLIDGGYSNSKYWTQDGWAQLQTYTDKHPRYWVPDGPIGSHEYRLRTTFDIVPMAWDWPVCADYHEALAYCTWRGQRDNATYRIISEAEFKLLRDPLPETPSPYEDIAVGRDGHELARMGINLNLAFGSESPVDGGPRNKAGFYDVSGNLWQWCRDIYAPLPGFQVHSYYEDLSLPAFDGKHQLQVGGAFSATGEEASIWDRIPFPPEVLTHSGIRLVRCLDDTKSS